MKGITFGISITPFFWRARVDMGSSPFSLKFLQLGPILLIFRIWAPDEEVG